MITWPMGTSMQAIDIQWSNILHFRPTEFPPGELSLTLAKTIFVLDHFRNLLGSQIYPSTAPGALARTDGSPTSMHRADPDRCMYSIAIDVFPEEPIRAWMAAQTVEEIGGIGLYTDTWRNGAPSIMLHLDLRAREGGLPTLWWRDGAYTYLTDERSTRRALRSAILWNNEDS